MDHSIKYVAQFPVDVGNKTYELRVLRGTRVVEVWDMTFYPGQTLGDMLLDVLFNPERQLKTIELPEQLISEIIDLDGITDDELEALKEGDPWCVREAALHKELATMLTILLSL